MIKLEEYSILSNMHRLPSPKTVSCSCFFFFFSHHPVVLKKKNSEALFVAHHLIAMEMPGMMVQNIF